MLLGKAVFSRDLFLYNVIISEYIHVETVSIEGVLHSRAFGRFRLP